MASSIQKLQKIPYGMQGWTDIMKLNDEILTQMRLEMSTFLDVDDGGTPSNGDVLVYNASTDKFEFTAWATAFPSIGATTTTTTITASTSTTSTSNTVSTTTVSTTTVSGTTSTSTASTTTVTTTTVAAAAYGFDSAESHADILLSNGDKTADQDAVANGQKLARGKIGKSSGKWYYELYLDVRTADAFTIGWADASHSLTQRTGEDGSNVGVGWHSNTGRVYHDGSYTTYGGSATDDDYVMVAIDFATGDIWFGVNGSWLSSGDPANGTNPSYTESEFISGTYYPAVALYNVVHQCTIRGLDSEMSGTIPSGFTSIGETAATTTSTSTSTSTTTSTTVSTSSTSTVTTTTSDYTEYGCVLNPDDKNTNVALSDGNLRATVSASVWAGVRATLGKSSGKWYWEVTIGDTATYHSVGIAKAGTALASYVGSTSIADSYGWVDQTGTVRKNGSNVASPGAINAEDIIMIALDLDNEILHFGKNGSWLLSSVPASATGGVDISSSFPTNAAYPCVAVGGYGDDCTVLMNFGNEDFSYSIPSGFDGLCGSGTTTTTSTTSTTTTTTV